MNMNELIEKIERLEKQLAEKEHELHLIKEDLEAVRATLEAAMENESATAAETPAIPAEEAPREKEIEELARAQADENDSIEEEPAAESNEEQQHEAIMRTIEEFSQEQRKSTVKQMVKPESVSLADKVSARPLNDIKKAIGINERFLYANVLFNGDMGAFSRAVEELNHLESILDATRLMDEELSVKYLWDDEDETVIAFKTLVSRRFS
jgi:chromosome segregation ATPase